MTTFSPEFNKQSKLDEIRKEYLEACRLKDIARKSKADNAVYQDAAKYFKLASDLSKKLSTNTSLSTDDRIQSEVFSLYYAYEENESLSGYYYEQHDTEKSKLHRNVAQKSINDAINLVNSSLPSLSEISKTHLQSNIPQWTYIVKSNMAKDLGLEARYHWDNGNLIEALDLYKRIIPLSKEALEYAVEKQLDQVYIRIAEGNFIGMSANAASVMALIILEKRTSKTNAISSDDLILLFKYTLEAYQLAEAAFNANPEWEQYRENSAVCIESIKKTLELNKPFWLNFYIEFEENKEFLKIMRLTDIEEFKKTEIKRHFRENKSVKLWQIGSFFLLSFIIVVMGIMYIMTSNLSLWQLFLTLGVVETILLFIGAFSLRTLGDLSEEGFLKLISIAFKNQFNVFNLSKSKETDVENIDTGNDH